MANRFIVEEVRATGWSVRLRDPLTGDVHDVPLSSGARFAPPSSPRSDAAKGEQATHAAQKGPKETVEDKAVDKPQASKKVKRKVGSQRKSSRTKDAEPKKDSKNPLATAEGRMQRIDADSLTADDHVAIEKQQAMFRRAAGLREGKRGGLGWQETTDSGRSGLRARYHTGAFKILHAGGDTYALFYEWDGGKYERLACGAVEDLMDIAAKRAQQELPKPPRTLLDLELARIMCGTPEQRKTAEERLEPVFREVRSQADDEPARPQAGDEPARPRRGRRVTPPPAEPEPSASPPTTEPTAASVPPVDSNRDAELTASFKQALAEMEG